MNETVDNFLINGCGRCTLYGTSDCKVNQWVKELKLLRDIVLESGLKEECKWGAPCYTYQGKNVVMVVALKGFCGVSFFKGALLEDPESLLSKPGPNSQAARVFKFTSFNQIVKHRDYIKLCVLEALEAERLGKRVKFDKKPETIPVELENILAQDVNLRVAFEAFTPGRQRGYILYFSQPKRSATRTARIIKSMGKILNGEGLHDQYTSKRKK
ncbi:MAG: YdeI/OmpD-associated family protein [Bacteroidia bacterium]|nr:YdeI/OmpD-associated family protein [Bacteroidia bacterium]